MKRGRFVFPEISDFWKVSEPLQPIVTTKETECQDAHRLLNFCGVPMENEDGEPLYLPDRIKIYAQNRADRPISGLTEDTICIPVDDYDQLCQAAEKYHATQNV